MPVTTFEEDFRTLVLRPAVVALVVDRVTWDELPGASVRPLVTLWDITDSGLYTMDGPSGLEQRTVQMDCWGLDFGEARDLADTVKQAIDAYRGTIGGTVFQGVFFTGRRSSNDPVAGAPAQRYSRVSLDAEIWHAAT